MKSQTQDKGQKSVAIYARTSGYNQRFNFSISGQVNACLQHCKQEGWIVKNIFIDEAKTGENTDRPKFQQMLQQARRKEFNIICAWKIDRICRSLADLVVTERELRRLSIGIFSVTEHLDTVSAIGRFNFRNLASFSELEREIISERTKMGLFELIKLHRWPTGKVPLGFDKRKNGTLKPNPIEVALVTKVFHDYIRLKSLPEVAFRLNKEGLQNEKIKHWTAKIIFQIITNTLYIGQFSVAGFTEHVKELEIIDIKLFRKANRILKRYKKGSRRLPMPADRKAAELEKIFNKYTELLETASRPPLTIFNG